MYYTTVLSEVWGKKTNKMQQYRWFIVNYGCWLLKMSQHVSGIFMPVFRIKDHCMWSVFAVTRKDADISRVVFYGDSVWYDKLGLLVCVCVCSRVWLGVS